MELKQEHINEVLDGMFGAIEKEQVELYKTLVNKTHHKEIKTVDDFYFGLVYPYEEFLSGLIKTTISCNSDVGFILKHSRFIESHFEKLIKNTEGVGCCADKSRTIMHELLSFYNDGRHIVFDYEQQYTYHLPKAIFKTHESIIGFYEGLRGLYYGNPEKYLAELLKIAKTQTEKEEGLGDNTSTTSIEQ